MNNIKYEIWLPSTMILLTLCLIFVWCLYCRDRIELLVLLIFCKAMYDFSLKKKKEIP